MKTYVVGFAFNKAKTRVVLIEKRKPDWQAGLFNGLGGKIEEHESPAMAMEREYAEEAGMLYSSWELFCKVQYDLAIVYFFRAFDDDLYRCSCTCETEEVYKFNTEELPENVIHNLVWLIPLALDPEVSLTISQY